MKRTRLVLKTVIIIIAVPMALYANYDNYQSLQAQKKAKQIIPVGIYKVTSFVKNNDSLNIHTDSTVWKDVVLDYANQGSIHAIDSAYRIRYGRSYFNYFINTAADSLKFHWNNNDLAAFKYKLKGDTILLNGTQSKDSLKLQLVKMKRHFQLTEKQFHWLSEANR